MKRSPKHFKVKAIVLQKFTKKKTVDPCDDEGNTVGLPFQDEDSTPVASLFDRQLVFFDLKLEPLDQWIKNFVKDYRLGHFTMDADHHMAM
eukprot:1204324-Rhodomonas_salina.1